MSNIFLAKPKLSSDVIEAAIGESHIIRDNFLNTFKIDEKLQLNFTKDLYEYPEPNGYKPLVDLLEKKYNAPIIITNGAKQALSASFYTLQQIGKYRLGMKLPYWALIPPLAKQYNLDSVFEEYDVGIKAIDDLYCGDDYGYLLLAPNNPSGETANYDKFKEIEYDLKSASIPLIHDAAYYTHTYLPPDYTLGTFGDMQIFSASKMFGCSGLRIGWIVCYNTDYYKFIQEYMEMMTVGVSTISQKFMFDILDCARKHPELEKTFEAKSREGLLAAKKLVKTINKEILEVPEDIENIPGMFLWAKTTPKTDFDKAKIHLVPGKLFGDADRVRINLALPYDVLGEVVNRLNGLVEK